MSSWNRNRTAMLNNEDNIAERHQRQERPGVFRSRDGMVDPQTTQREAPLHQSEIVCMRLQAVQRAVLDRLGLQNYQGPSVDNSRTTQGNTLQRSPEIIEKDNIRDWSYNQVFGTSERCVRSPVSNIPQPRRRVLGIPVMSRTIRGSDKKDIGGYPLQTTKDQLEEIRNGWENFRQNFFTHQRKPPMGQRRKKLPPLNQVPVQTPVPAKKMTTRDAWTQTDDFPPTPPSKRASTNDALSETKNFTPTPPATPAPARKNWGRRRGFIPTPALGPEETYAVKEYLRPTPPAKPAPAKRNGGQRQGFIPTPAPEPEEFEETYAVQEDVRPTPPAKPAPAKRNGGRRQGFIPTPAPEPEEFEETYAVQEDVRPTPPAKPAPAKRNGGLRQGFIPTPAPEPEEFEETYAVQEDVRPTPPAKPVPAKRNGGRRQGFIPTPAPEPEEFEETYAVQEDVRPTPPAKPAPAKRNGARRQGFIPTPAPEPEEFEETYAVQEDVRPTPPAKPVPAKRNGVRRQGFIPTPAPEPEEFEETYAVQEDVRPTPPAKPAPAKRNGGRRQGFIPTTAPEPEETEETYDVQNVCSSIAELDPIKEPGKSVSLSFELISDSDWEKKVSGLKMIKALAQHNLEELNSRRIDVCLNVTEEIKNPRSAVASAAIDTLVYLLVYFKENLESQVEDMVRALLQKIVQANANAFLRKQVLGALEVLVQNSSPGRVIKVLVQTGLSHLNSAVREASACQLHVLADKLKMTGILSAGKAFTENFLAAVNKMALDSAAEVRKHGLAILQDVAAHKSFRKHWDRVVIRKDRPYLEKILSKMKN
ncbi:formin-like protein 14 [Notolabrus celidotus]|uniref:formin-like protein 14 n=1 Tax=Notolabrus celidotus TaxID=1203425 RepID=UPI00148FDC71|nr:formin-like protein 14 [Notolabrus celidotus]